MCILIHYAGCMISSILIMNRSAEIISGIPPSIIIRWLVLRGSRLWLSANGEHAYTMIGELNTDWLVKMNSGFQPKLNGNTQREEEGKFHRIRGAVLI